MKSSENLNVASGKGYQIDQTEVLNATTLGSSVVNSSLTNLGTLTALTVSGAIDANGDLDVDGHTELDDVNVSGAITATTFTGDLTGNAGTATALETPKTFEITGDVVASAISFDGTGNVSLAATIQPNSVALATDTTGDFVQSITGTANEIEVTGGTGENSTPQIGLPNDVTIGQDLSVSRNINVSGISTFESTVSIGTTIDIVPYNDLGTLSFEGSAGQLFSITNNLTSGSIFFC